MTGKKILIIGGDAAGMSAASLAKRRDPELAIEVFEMGDHTSYGACGMPYYVAGDVPDLDDLVVLTPRQFIDERGIQVHMRHRVERIRPDQRTIEVRDLTGDQTKTLGYDELLIATGAEPIIPPGLDTSHPAVFTLRGLPDAAAIKKLLVDRPCRTGIIVGTGYIGMEMAEALTRAGLEVTVVGRRPQVMPTYEEEISTLVTTELTRQGVRLQTGAEAARIDDGPEGRPLLTLTDGRALVADLIVIGAGVAPRSQLAGPAGIETGVKKAIKVDRRQRTNQANVWAAGDCAEHYHRLLDRNTYIPLALPANRQGRVVGFNLSGTPAEFPGVLGSAVCKVFDLTVARTGLGLAEARAAGLEVVKVPVTSNSRPRYYPGSAPISSILIVEKGSGRPWGAQMAGRNGVGQRINIWATALGAGMSLKQIYDLDLAYAPPYSPVWDPILIASELAMKKIK